MDFHNLAYWQQKARELTIETRLFINGEYSAAADNSVFTTVDPDSGHKALDQEPLRTLAKFRKAPEGVLFGQNVIAEGETELVVGMPVEVLD